MPTTKAGIETPSDYKIKNTPVKTTNFPGSSKIGKGGRTNTIEGPCSKK